MPTISDAATPVTVPAGVTRVWPEFRRLAVARDRLDDYLHEAAAMLAELMGTPWYAWGEVASDGVTLIWHVCNPTLDSGPLAEPQRQRIQDPRAAAAALALQQARPLVVDDFTREGRFHDALWRQRRAASGLFCPLVDGNRPLGVLAAFSAKAQAFSPSAASIADSVAHMAVATIARARAEDALGRERRLHQSLWESMPALMVILNQDGRVVRINKATETTTCFSLEEVKDRTLWGAFLLPEEVATVRSALEALRRGEQECQLECYILTKHGDRRRISWVFARLSNESGECESLVGSGVDVTEKYAALERLAKSNRKSEQLPSADTTVGGHSPAALAELPLDADTKAAIAQVIARPDGDADSPAKSEVEEKQDGSKSCGRERRRNIRRAYPYVQAVAPIVGKDLPPRSTFREVRCRDISPAGFSYLSPVSPKHRQVVVAFGSAPRLIYLKAEIIHVSPAKYNGVNVFHVGCRYLHRVEL